VSSDAIDSPDLGILRSEVLKARDRALGEAARADVQADRVTELEAELHELGSAMTTLSLEVNRPLVRVARAVQRRLQRGQS
jgi:hypothetical protein